jgi:hypothetical protein
VRTITWIGVTPLIAALGVALLRPFNRHVDCEFHDPDHRLTYNHLAFLALAVLGAAVLAWDLFTRVFDF